MKVFNLTLCVLFLFGSLLKATIYVNQLGYLPEEEKGAYTTTNVDSFFLVEQSSGKIVFAEPLRLRKTDDPATGLTLYEADFSTFTTPGRFTIQLSNGEESVPFCIADSVFQSVALKSLKGLYFQRCGTTLQAEFAEDWSHGTCHSTDALFHASCDTFGYLKTSGGWHDAGDYGKYVVPAANALAYLLFWAEYFPQGFTTDSLNIPESGNSIPDVLDEARWELEWLLTMQDSALGGVYFKVTTKNFVGWVMPDDSYETRYIYQISSTATADFAAIMARAYRLFNQYDSAFANQCLQAARNAWRFLEENPDIVPEGGFQNPDDTETGAYEDSDDSDERLWAAAELFETTGEEKYNSYFLDHYQQGGIINGQTSWQNVKPLAQITYLNSSQVNASSTAKENILNALVDYAEETVSISQNDGFRVALQEWEYYWGSNSVVLSKATMLIFTYKATANLQYRQTALHQLNYILGCNAHNMTFVTALGTNSPLHIHHAPSVADGVEPPVPGLMAGGPNRYLDDPALQQAFNSQTPPALCYLDDQDSYASNEIAIYWNAPLFFVSAYFNQQGQSNSLINEVPLLPRTTELYQNFPNPFNPRTVIQFYLPKAAKVSLEIFTVQGTKVCTLIQERDLPAGRHQVIWEGQDALGKPVASGVYFYRLATVKTQITKKLIFLR